MTTTTTAKASGTFLLGGDLPVRRLGFGAMRITGEGVWGPPKDRPEALAVLRAAVEWGINLIDTADSYGPNVSEELIAEALHPYPPGLVIATKAGFLRHGPDDWEINGEPARLRAAAEGSLRRLRLECIDLFQLHRIDENYPLEDQIAVLAGLQREGKIRHIGLSEVSIAQIEAVRRIVDVASVQNRYNIADREHESVLDYCTRENIAFIPWYPLATGDVAEHALLGRVGERFGARPAQVALAWLLARSPVMLPIPGTSRTNHLRENVAAAGIALDESAMHELDRVR